MEIYLLALSVGSSRLAVGAFRAGELVYTRRLTHGQHGDWPAALAEAWGKVSAGRGTSDASPEVAGACVNPSLRADVADAVRAATSQAVQWVGDAIDLPIKVLTENPQKTGVDRVLNVAAAYEQIGKACVVVDAGTAVTVDCCDDKGAFLGGVIAPGVRLQLASLRQAATHLPEVSFATAFGPPADPVPRSTDEAMRAGVYHGIRGLVKETVEAYADRLGVWPELVATGGDAQALFEGWELVHAISPDLTLWGVALAYAEHHIRHGT